MYGTYSTYCTCVLQFTLALLFPIAAPWLLAYRDDFHTPAVESQAGHGRANGHEVEGEGEKTLYPPTSVELQSTWPLYVRQVIGFVTAPITVYSYNLVRFLLYLTLK